MVCSMVMDTSSSFYLVEIATLLERKGIEVGRLKDPSSLPLSIQIIFSLNLKISNKNINGIFILIYYGKFY